MHLTNQIEYLNNLYNSNNQENIIKQQTFIKNLKKYNSCIYKQYFSSFNKFKKYLIIFKICKHKINDYTNSKDKDFKINKKYLTEHIKKDIYSFLCGEKKNYYKKYNNCKIYEKFKGTGDKNISFNYRYLTDHHIFIKIVDRIFIDINKKLVNSDTVDTNIFILKILDIKVTPFVNVAIHNTLSKERVLCIDFKNAYDNVEWDNLRNHMIDFYIKSISLNLATLLTNFYFFILQNRRFEFKKNKINVKKGISQGFPSSTLIYTIFLMEIINNWKRKININIDQYMILNIYVDDIYIKFKSYSIINNYLLCTLINEFKLNNIIINNLKCFGDKKLNLSFEYNDFNKYSMYLGIPFTRNPKEYINCIMHDFFKKKHNLIKDLKIIFGNKKIPNNSIVLQHFYNIICSNDINNKILKQNITGFFRYKFKPFSLNKMDNNELLIVFKYFLNLNMYQTISSSGSTIRTIFWLLFIYFKTYLIKLFTFILD